MVDLPKDMLNWKVLLGTNTIAFLSSLSVMKIKNCITLTPVVKVIIHFSPSLTLRQNKLERKPLVSISSFV
jgi:hypothetical protein